MASSLQLKLAHDSLGALYIIMTEIPETEEVMWRMMRYRSHRLETS
jgi:hypothetical protein